MNKEFKCEYCSETAPQKCSAAAPEPVLPHTYKEEMGSEYRVAAEPLRGHRNKHHY